MKPVDQTRFSPTEMPLGNCFGACVASILEAPLSDVLDDGEMLQGELWWRTWEAWLNQRGFGLVHLGDYPPAWFLPAKGYSIMSGKSPRGDFLHSVVALNGELVHDPHPSRDGVVNIVDWVILYPHDPVRISKWR